MCTVTLVGSLQENRLAVKLLDNWLYIFVCKYAPSGIQSTEAECSSGIETKPMLYLQATTAGP